MDESTWAMPRRAFAEDYQYHQNLKRNAPSKSENMYEEYTTAAYSHRQESRVGTRTDTRADNAYDLMGYEYPPEHEFRAEVSKNDDAYQMEAHGNERQSHNLRNPKFSERNFEWKNDYYRQTPSDEQYNSDKSSWDYEASTKRIKASDDRVLRKDVNSQLHQKMPFACAANSKDDVHFKGSAGGRSFDPDRPMIRHSFNADRPIVRGTRPNYDKSGDSLTQYMYEQDKLHQKKDVRSRQELNRENQPFSERLNPGTGRHLPPSRYGSDLKPSLPHYERGDYSSYESQNDNKQLDIMPYSSKNDRDKYRVPVDERYRDHRVVEDVRVTYTRQVASTAPRHIDYEWAPAQGLHEEASDQKIQSGRFTENDMWPNKKRITSATNDYADSAHFDKSSDTWPERKSILKNSNNEYEGANYLNKSLDTWSNRNRISKSDNSNYNDSTYFDKSARPSMVHDWDRFSSEISAPRQPNTSSRPGHFGPYPRKDIEKVTSYDDSTHAARYSDNFFLSKPPVVIDYQHSSSNLDDYQHTSANRFDGQRMHADRANDDPCRSAYWSDDNRRMPPEWGKDDQRRSAYQADDSRHMSDWREDDYEVSTNEAEDYRHISNNRVENLGQSFSNRPQGYQQMYSDQDDGVKHSFTNWTKSGWTQVTDCPKSDQSRSTDRTKGNQSWSAGWNEDQQDMSSSQYEDYQPKSGGRANLQHSIIGVQSGLKSSNRPEPSVPKRGVKPLMSLMASPMKDKRTKLPGQSSETQPTVAKRMKPSDSSENMRSKPQALPSNRKSIEFNWQPSFQTHQAKTQTTVMKQTNSSDSIKNPNIINDNQKRSEPNSTTLVKPLWHLTKPSPTNTRQTTQQISASKQIKPPASKSEKKVPSSQNKQPPKHKLASTASGLSEKTPSSQNKQPVNTSVPQPVANKHKLASTTNGPPEAKQQKVSKVVLSDKWKLDPECLTPVLLGGFKMKTTSLTLKTLIECIELLKDGSGSCGPNYLIAKLKAKDLFFAVAHKKKDFLLFIQRYPLLFSIRGESVTLIEDQLSWSSQKEETKPEPAPVKQVAKLEPESVKQVSKLQPGPVKQVPKPQPGPLKQVSEQTKETSQKKKALEEMEETHEEILVVDKQWLLDFDNSFLPLVWRKLDTQASALQVLVLIIEEMKMSTGSTSISDLFKRCVLLNTSCTNELRSVLGERCIASDLKRFLSKFPSVFNIKDDKVTLIDRILKWSYSVDGKDVMKPFRGFSTDVEAIHYFRDRILKEIKENDPWLSFTVFQSFFQAATTDINLCVGSEQECWVSWLLKYSFIFKVKIHEKKVALRETLPSARDGFTKPASVSLSASDFELTMLIRYILHMKSTLPIDEVFSFYKQLPNFHKAFPRLNSSDFGMFIWRNTSIFTVDEKKMVSLNERVAPIVFVMGLSYPYNGTDCEYVGHGQIKLFDGPQAVLQTTIGKNTESLYINRVLFGNCVKPIKSCFKIGDWLSFSALLIKNKLVGFKAPEKWSVKKVWTLTDTFEELQKKFAI